MKIVKQQTPAPPIWESYRRTVGVRGRLISEGASLTIPSAQQERESGLAASLEAPCVVCKADAKEYGNYCWLCYQEFEGYSD